MLSDADLKITLPRLTPAVVAEVIEKMTGTRIEVPAGIAGLSFDEISLCLRRGDSAQNCLARLERAAKSARRITPIPDDTPPIEPLRGYGDALVFRHPSMH